MKAAFLRRSKKPTYSALAQEFAVSRSSVFNKASEEGWPKERELFQATIETSRTQGAKAAVRNRPKVSPIQVLNDAIADISAEIAVTEAKSKEGCASTLARLLETQRALFPPNADELAAIAVQLNIKPQDFLEALKKRWEAQQGEDKAGRSMNG